MIPTATTELWLAVGALLALALVLYRGRTVLLGFTFLSCVTLASASHAAFLFGSLFGLDDSWITHAHLQVFNYSALGLVAFSVGTLIAWRSVRGPLPRPMAQRGTAARPRPIAPKPSARLVRAHEDWRESPTFSLTRLPWLNVRFGWLCMAIGIAAYLLTPIAFQVPTVRAIWSGYHVFMQVGLLILLICSMRVGSYVPFLQGLAVAVPLTLMQMILTGHIGAAGLFTIQLLLVATFWQRVTLRSVFLSVVGLAFITSLMVGWLDSRYLIREGTLNQYGLTERVWVFLEEFEYVSPFAMQADDVQRQLRSRIDMSDILAAQSRWQPLVEPYLWGQNVLQEAAAAVVPRILWPDKPTRLGGSEFVSRYSGLTFAEGTSVGLPYQFELYVHGGAPLVIIGLGFLGWLTAAMELRLFDPSISIRRFMIYIISLQTLITGSQTFSALIMTLGAGAVGGYLIGLLLERWTSFPAYWQSGLSPLAAEPLRPRPGHVALGAVRVDRPGK